MIVPGLTNVAEIAAVTIHIGAHLRDGTARCWGENRDGQLGDGATSNRNTASRTMF